MKSIGKSVGRGAVNHRQDVRHIQELLNHAVNGLKLQEDGSIGPATIAAIDYFQAHVLRVRPDGRVDPAGATLIKLNEYAAGVSCGVESLVLPAAGDTAPLKEVDFAACAKKLGCDVAAVRAVSEVESHGSGFLPSRRPTLLFEAHVFSRFTFHCYDRTYPDISSKSWDKSLYEGDEDEYPRLLKAMALDREAALKSASWGRFQLMGFNHKICGFGSVESFVTAMFSSESKHLAAFVAYVKSCKADIHLKNKDWESFAAAFNGPDYFENDYDDKLAAAYQKYSGKR